MKATSATTWAAVIATAATLGAVIVAKLNISGNQLPQTAVRRFIRRR